MSRWLYLLVGVALGLFGGLLVSRYLRERRQPPAQSIATIDGEPLKLSDFLGQLKLAVGPRTVRVLFEQHLIAREAERLGIRLSPEEEKKLAAFLDTGPQDPERRLAAERTFRSQWLLRKILLKDVPESTIREVYDLYGEQLRQYEVSAIVLNDRAELNEILANLKAGGDFSQVARVYSTVPSRDQGGLLGYLTLAQTEAALGIEARRALERLQPGQVSRPFYGRLGTTILKLGEVRSSYEQLKPQAALVVAQSKTPDFFYQQFSKAQIQSPLLKQPIQSIVPAPVTEPRESLGEK